MMTKKLASQEQNKRIEKAVYTPQELPDYQGNPLIEALGSVLPAGEAYDRLCYFPQYHENERQLYAELRYNALYRLQHFFQPVMRHLELEKLISRLLRSGYISRSPLNPGQVQLLTGQPVPNLHSTASSFTLMGVSGIGKTTAVERVLALYPQCILHEHPINRIQITYLKLNCPHDGSLKSLCMDFFLKIDILIGTNYYSKFGNRRNSIDSMIIQMGRIARLHCVGLLVIDEIQHLLTAKEKGSEKMMNFFVTLINEIGIPIIMVGTMRARSILQQDFRQARRGSGQGDMIWETMLPDDDWDYLIEALWKYQWTKNVIPLSEELRDTIYEESQGIIDIAVKLYSLAQSRAIETEKEIITATLLKQVAREDLRLVQPMLQALRSGNPDNIIKYEDIVPMDLGSYLQTHKSKIDMRGTIQKKKEEQEEARKKYEDCVAAKAIHALISIDIEPKLAEKSVMKILNESQNDINQAMLVTQALSMIENERSTVFPLKRPKMARQSKLQDCIDEGKTLQKSAYQSLKHAEYIKDPLKEFAV